MSRLLNAKRLVWGAVVVISTAVAQLRQLDVRESMPLAAIEAFAIEEVPSKSGKGKSSFFIVAQRSDDPTPTRIARWPDRPSGARFCSWPFQQIRVPTPM
jgi:hypothetical protein